MIEYLGLDNKMHDSEEDEEDCSHELRRAFVDGEWFYRCEKCEETFYLLPRKIKKGELAKIGGSLHDFGDKMTKEKDKTTIGISATAKRKAVFFDRDDTLIRNYGNRPANCADEVELLATAVECVNLLRSAGFLLLVVSNQGGIGLGYVDAKSVHEQNARLDDLLRMGGSQGMDAYSFCPHAPNDGCSCRKPQPGMILDLAKQLNVDLSRSYIVGDHPRDMEAGRIAGLRGCIGVGNGKFWSDQNCDAQFPDLIQCAKAILAGEEQPQ